MVAATLYRRTIPLLAALLVAGCASTTPTASSTPTAGTYSFWPPSPDAPHVQFLMAYNASHDVTPASSKFDEMLYGKESGVSIVKPYGLAMWNGRIYVTDLRTRGVIVLDIRQKQVRIMGNSGRADLQTAVAIAISPDGTKYVIDSAKNSIVVFDAEERHVTTFTAPNFNPVDLAIYQNELFVSDFDNSIVKVLDAGSGRLLRTIGGPGEEEGKFRRPLGICIDNQGNVLVADVFKCRVQKFTRDGKFIFGFGENGNRPGDFVRPKHLAVDKQGMIYIVDAAFNNVQVFDDQGKIVGYFGSLGNHPGAMSLPAGVWITESDLDLFASAVHPAFEARRLILVSNQFGNQKIAVYAEGVLKPGKTVADLESSRAKVAGGLTTGAPPTSQPITIGTPLPEEFLSPTTAPTTRNR